MTRFAHAISRAGRRPADGRQQGAGHGGHQVILTRHGRNRDPAGSVPYLGGRDPMAVKKTTTKKSAAAKGRPKKAKTRTKAGSAKKATRASKKS
jgi:hypothetical protein